MKHVNSDLAYEHIRKRILSEEFSPLAVFLAFKGAVGITGQAYNVDGGTITW